MIKYLGIIVLGLSILAAYFWFSVPRTYADCILRNVKGAERAAVLVKEACRIKHPVDIDRFLDSNEPWPGP